MKILVINYEYPPVGGGGGMFTRDLAEKMAEKHQIDVLTGSFPGSLHSEVVNNVTIYRAPVLFRRSRYAASMISMLSYPFSALAKGLPLTRSESYDMIHTHFAVPSGPAGTLLSRISGIPNILSIHGSDIYNPVKKFSPHKIPIFRWAVRNALRNADRVVAQSSHLKDFAVGIYRPEREIDIIPLGTPLPDFRTPTRSELGLLQDRKYLVSIGRMDPVKGYCHLLEALKRGIDRGLDLGLILLGDGPERSRLEHTASKLGIGDKVEFKGWISGSKKFQYLSASDVYVMSSIHEGFGVVLLEAMHCGLPVIATDKGGQTDIIKDGRNGILVPPANPEALAEAVVSMFADKELMASFSRNNENDVKRFSMEAIAERYESLFYEVLSEKRRK